MKVLNWKHSYLLEGKSKEECLNKLKEIGCTINNKKDCTEIKYDDSKEAEVKNIVERWAKNIANSYEE